MSIVFVQAKRYSLPASDLIGKGGEADVYQFGLDAVLKRYKEASDPDYVGNITAQLGATQRLKEQQRKLPAFPAHLPGRVIAPRELVYDKAAGGHIVGYTMPYLRDMELLLSYGNRQYREQGGIDGNRIISIFRDLHQVVQSVHRAGVVIGDFNDLNVLVDATDQSYLIDADSMQFGGFACQTFTNRFLDPRLSGTTRLVLERPHDELSDWYAYLVMLCQSLLYVGPYGGVHLPKAGKRLQHDDRVLQRLTFFSPDIRYPKPALPLSVLPDGLLDYLHKVFEQDLRQAFPLDQLNAVRWTHCTACGTLHARSSCPTCAAPGAVIETTVIRGTVTATRVFRTSGQLLYATVQAGKLRYLYHEAGVFRREGGERVLDGQLDPKLRYRVQADRTLLGQGDKLFVLQSGQLPERQTVDSFQGLTMYDANASHYYWVQNGQLVRNGRYGSDYVGDVLAGQTLLWVGKRFGFGFYRAGQLLRCFVFRDGQRGLNDQVTIPNLPGQLIDATCVFSDDRAWFMVSLQESGKLVNRCYVISIDGSVIATAEATQGDNSWLASGIRGHLAVGSALFTATDEGIVRVNSSSGSVVVETSYPDTEQFVNSVSQLLPSPDGIYAVSNQEIVLLRIRSS